MVLSRKVASGLAVDLGYLLSGGPSTIVFADFPMAIASTSSLTMVLRLTSINTHCLPIKLIGVYCGLSLSFYSLSVSITV